MPGAGVGLDSAAGLGRGTGKKCVVNLAAGHVVGRRAAIETAPERGIGGDPWLGRGDRPAGLHHDRSAKRHGAFGAEQPEEGQPRLDPGYGTDGLPVDRQPRFARYTRQDRPDFGFGDLVPRRGGAEGDPEEAQPGLRGIDRGFHELKLRSAGAGKLHQLDPVADCAQRVDKVMADARAEKGEQVGHRYLREADMENLNAFLEPGMLVRHPERPDWGTGQVQSNIGGKVTVMFPDEGKVVIDGERVVLVMVSAG